jgi:cytidine deaminase
MDEESDADEAVGADAAGRADGDGDDVDVRVDVDADVGVDVRALVEAAREAFEAAHVPYSEYPVGAALETVDGETFVGCNLENANYSNSLHAEEVAIAEAVKRGRREFAALAVASAARDGVTPCGMCRQTLAEFCEPSLPVYCDGPDGVRAYTLGELLPEAISLDTLEAAARDRGDATTRAEDRADGDGDDGAGPDGAGDADGDGSDWDGPGPAGGT